ALLRMHIEGQTAAIVTTILDVDTDNNTFIVDNSAEDDFNQRAIKAHKVLFETLLDKVQVLFSVTGITACTHDSRPALCASVPAGITRIQRREYYRVDIPVTNRAMCIFSIPENKDAMRVELELKDISAGGISVLDNNQVLDNTLNTIFKACRLDLPEAGTVVTDLQVVRSQDDTLAKGKLS